MPQLTEEQKGIEELLKPRYLCIADFWNNPFEVGDVIQFEDYKDYHDFYTGDVLGKDWSTAFMELKKPYQEFSEGTSIVWNMRAFTPYPHLFRKLEWWEHREVSEMPEYVKSPIGFFKVEWIIRNDELFLSDATDKNDPWIKVSPTILPCTSTDYLNFKNKQ
ncbi:MAG: hypothetical protein V4547_17140 [Bacteroidota bacterium]